MNLKYITFAAGIMLATAGANADDIEADNLTVSKYANFNGTSSFKDKVEMSDELKVSGDATITGELWLPYTEKSNYFIRCTNKNLNAAYSTAFYADTEGRIGATGLHLAEQSAGHPYTSHLKIHYNKTTSAFEFNTSSYPGGPGERYIDMKFYAKSYEFNKGDMVVNGKITCKDELNVTALNASSIKAEDINVNMSNAADYVFDENYNLKSLSEVESYVKENKHLPGIPSAAEMEQNGMSVSSMSNMLLEKVEELTLHMIRLEKENAALKAEVESLKK